MSAKGWALQRFANRIEKDIVIIFLIAIKSFLKNTQKLHTPEI